MNKLNYGSFDITNSDIAFSSTSGYDEPQSELERRKQLSYPLKEIKTFVNNSIPVRGDEVVQLVVSNENKLQYRTESSGILVDIVADSGLPTGGTSGQVLMKNSSANYDVKWGNANLTSFVGMVVSGTNLSTEASVQNIYGSSTRWSLLSSVMLASNHVYGNGKTLGVTNGSSLGGLNSNVSSSNIFTMGNTGAYGQNTSSTPSTSGNNMWGKIGVPTKTQVGENHDNTGLIVDTRTVYTWERTA